MWASALAADPTRPVLTFYDGATGERTELSGATLDNWLAKTANLLVDGLGLGSGDTAAVLLPAHWQTAAVLLGCWSAGLAVAHGPRLSRPVDVVFADPDRLDQAHGIAAGADVLAVSLHPLGLPMPAVPDGVADFLAEVRGHGDRFTPVDPPAPDTPALVDLPGGGADLDQRALVNAAREAAAGRGYRPEDRVLVAGDAPRPLDWLLAPLAVGASTLLCRRCDDESLARIRSTERVTTG
ncbi:MAG TPA: TIGR03089 family protein [Micromonosporaceae bacterium]